MAIHRIPILGFATRPDDTGEAVFEPADRVFGTNDLARQFMLRLGGADAAQPTVKHGVYGAFRVPKNYVGTAKIAITWATTLVANEVVFDFDYRAIAVAESGDPATWQESVTSGAITVDATARNEKETLLTLTSSNLVVDDIVHFFFGRDGADAADDVVGPVWVIELTFEYADA